MKRGVQHSTAQSSTSSFFPSRSSTSPALPHSTSALHCLLCANNRNLCSRYALHSLSLSVVPFPLLRSLLFIFSLPRSLPCHYHFHYCYSLLSSTFPSFLLPMSSSVSCFFLVFLCLLAIGIGIGLVSPSSSPSPFCPHTSIPSLQSWSTAFPSLFFPFFCSPCYFYYSFLCFGIN